MSPSMAFPARRASVTIFGLDGNDRGLRLEGGSAHSNKHALAGAPLSGREWYREIRR